MMIVKGCLIIMGVTDGGERGGGSGCVMRAVQRNA